LQLNSTQQQLKREAEAADAAYKASIKEFNNVQATYKEEMKHILAVRTDILTLFFLHLHALLCTIYFYYCHSNTRPIIPAHYSM
jgi:Fic family protein